MSVIKEKILESSPRPVSIEGTKTILSQMKNSICKIYKCNGTGFFCKIPFKNFKFKVLMTNYHVIDEEYIKDNKIMKISLNNENVDIKELNNRTIYFNKEYDIAIIEIKNSDKIEANYLDLGDEIFEDNSELIYENKSVYTLHYPKMDEASVSYGIIKNIENYDIKHTCCTEQGSSGSPIMYLLNNKVIGIHRGASPKYNYNLGSFIKNPINEFVQKGKKNLDKKKKNETNDDKNNKLNKSKIKLNNINDKIKKGIKNEFIYKKKNEINDDKNIILNKSKIKSNEVNDKIKKAIKNEFNNKNKNEIKSRNRSPK